MLILSAAATANAETPDLFLPMGSYLKDFNIGTLIFSNKMAYLKSSTVFDNQLLSFEPAFNLVGELIHTPVQCAQEGYDLRKGSTTDLACDTSVIRPYENAARFLYSALVPYGSYIHSCTGILRTRENDRFYLYASCRPENATDRGNNLRDTFSPNRLDITDCTGNIENINGVLKCTDSPVVPRRILSGSYLEDCNLSASYYDPDTQILYAVFPDDVSIGIGFTEIDPYYSITLENAGECIGAGKDIAKIDLILVCQHNIYKEVKEYTASTVIPAGNYLLTCKNMIYYPCLGVDGQGLLAAGCASVQNGMMPNLFLEAHLSDADDKCRMANMGYVSNVNGELVCDPDITFDDEDPTQGSDLSPLLQCNP